MVTAIIQARMGSNRLPGKVLKDVCGHPLLYFCVERLKISKFIDDIVIATTNQIEDDAVEEWCHGSRIKCYRGDSDNVLDRYYQAMINFGGDIIVRATADNPFVDPLLADFLITNLLMFKKDYVTVSYGEQSWPRGIGVEVMTANVLERVWQEAEQKVHLEHVTLYIKEKKNLFDTKEVYADNDYSDISVTVDYPKDYEVAKVIMDSLLSKHGIYFSWQDLVCVANKTQETFGYIGEAT